MVTPTCRPRILALFLVLACVAVFGEVGTHGFVRWDDGINVYQNPYLNPVTPAHLAHFWTGTGMGQTSDTVYRPLVYTAYAAIAQEARTTPYLSDSQTASLDARPFHAVSLLLHILNALLVFALLRRLVRSDWGAFAGALLFAIHPVQVESVAWVTGLTDLLGAFFSLLAIWEHLRFRETNQRRHFALATLWFLLAMLSKPSAAILPLIVLAVDHWLLGRSWRDGLKTLGAWLPLAAGSVLIAHHAEPILHGSVTTPWAMRPLIAGDALALALWHLIWPAPLTVDYGRSPAAVLGGKPWRMLLVVLALGALVWRVRRPWLFASTAILVLALLPTLGLIPFRFQTYSTVADRYSYLALLGPALALAWIVSRLPRHLPERGRLAVGTACAAMFLGLGLTSALQVTYWQNSFALFGHAVDVNPQSWMAHFNLGSMLADSRHPAEAAVEYREVLRDRSAYAPAYAAQDEYCLGMVLARQGRKPEAAAEFRRALNDQPDYAPAQEALRATR